MVRAFNSTKFSLLCPNCWNKSNSTLSLRLNPWKLVEVSCGGAGFSGAGFNPTNERTSLSDIFSSTLFATNGDKAWMLSVVFGTSTVSSFNPAISRSSARLAIVNNVCSLNVSLIGSVGIISNTPTPLKSKM